MSASHTSQLRRDLAGVAGGVCSTCLATLGGMPQVTGDAALAAARKLVLFSDYTVDKALLMCMLCVSQSKRKACKVLAVVLQGACQSRVRNLGEGLGRG